MSNTIKRLLGCSILISALLCFSNTALAVEDFWIGLHHTTAYDINSVYSLNASTAVAAGTAGLMLRTTNTGTNWLAYPSGVSVDLNSVYFLSEALGWAVGGSTTPGGSVFLVSTDGGITWARQAAPTGLSVVMYSVFFLNASTGWAVGASGRCVRTTDGGTTWTNVTMPGGTTYALYSVHFRDANNGYIVGGTGSTGYVLKSTDGGTTWSTPQQIAAQIPYAVKNVNELTAVTVGNNGAIYATTDGGTSWNVRTAPPGALRPLHGLVVLGDTLVAAGDTVVLASTNAGATWTRKTTGLASPRLINDITMLNPREGWAAGEVGVMYRTTDGGETWQFQLAGTTQPAFNVDLNGSYFLSPTVGWAVGANATGSVFLSTTDGGLSWTRQTAPTGYTVAMYGVFFFNANTGIAVGASGRCARTTDGGATWTAITIAGASSLTLYSVAFYDTSNGYIVGGTTTTGYVIKSTDGGITWGTPTQIAALPLFAVENVNSTTAVTVGNNGTIFSTTDGGTTWEGRTAPPGALRPLRGLSVVGNIVFAAGDTVVIVSTDGGVNWTRRTTGLPASRLLNNIAMINGNTGWAVGDAGTIYKTTDGGGTWTLQPGPYPTRSIKSVAFMPGFAFFVGAVGTMARNPTPVIPSVRDDGIGVPGAFVLFQNYPNPFNPSTNIVYRVKSRAFVELAVFDLLGRKIATLVNEVKPPGEYRFEWNAEGLPSGVYFYGLSADRFVQTRKLLLLK